MSNNYYEGQLSEVLVELRDLILIGETQVSSKANLPKNPIEQQHVFNQHYQSLYVKYINLYNKLEVWYFDNSIIVVITNQSSSLGML